MTIKIHPRHSTPTATSETHHRHVSAAFQTAWLERYPLGGDAVPARRYRPRWRCRSRTSPATAPQSADAAAVRGPAVPRPPPPRAHVWSAITCSQEVTGTQTHDRHKVGWTRCWWYMWLVVLCSYVWGVGIVQQWRLLPPLAHWKNLPG